MFIPKRNLLLMGLMFLGYGTLAKATATCSDWGVIYGNDGTAPGITKITACTEVELAEKGAAYTIENYDWRRVSSLGRVITKKSKLIERRGGYLHFGAQFEFYECRAEYDCRTGSGAFFSGAAVRLQKEVACPPELPNLNMATGCYGVDQAPVKACGTANPIIIADGRKIQPEPADLNMANGLFQLQRTYTTNTEQDNATFSIPIPAENAPAHWRRFKVPAGHRFGYGYISDPFSRDVAGVQLKATWYVNKLPRLEISGATLFRLESQHRQVFTKQSDGSYISREFRGDKVQPAEGGWRYQPEPGVVEQYDASGLLVRRQQQGRTLAISYNAQKQPERLTAGDEQLLLSYDDARRLSRAELDSEWVSYGYDERNRLVSVTRNDGRVRQYHYEDPRFPEALTGITDERGVRYATFQYDAQGRAIESRHGEQDRYQFVFGNNQTTVINPLGKETIYRYTNLSGIKRLTAVEGVPSENCAGANKAYSYYPNGQLQTHTDWQGVVTRFEYNSRGLVSREIEAEGTPLQRETRYEYHPVHPWPLRITSGLNITEYDYDDHGNLRASRVLPR